jgi:hypothetical protein
VVYQPKVAKDGFDEYRTGYIICSVQIVEKYDFYGFHGRKEKFLKIFTYDPKYVKRLAKILSMGLIMNRNFNIYEVSSLKTLL